MTTYKEPKPELIAIYRLEFYKKQKNWKFSTSRKEKKTSKKSTEKINLNVTYNIEQPETTEPPDVHNVAFVECVSVTDSSRIKCSNIDTHDKELSQQWLEPVNIWPQTEPLDAQDASANNLLQTNFDYNNQNLYNSLPKTNAQTRLDELQKAARSFETEKQACAEANIGLQDAWIESDCLKEYYHWPVECGLNVGQSAQNMWSRASEDTTDGCDINNIQSIEDLYPPSYCGDVYWAPGDESVMSVDSAGEFMRGADAAPHSSELDLALPPCVSALDVSFASLSALSSAQLAVAARLHARVLRRVLREAEQRQKLRTAASFYNLPSFDEFPTRDPGPLRPSGYDEDPNLFFKDMFLAGSHRGAAEGRGRGRGRLPEGSFKR